jgi:phage terminase large subunit
VTTIDIPKAFRDLFKPHRIKVYHGGRGGAKSESVARYLLSEGTKERMTILCAREYQTSIKDSVYQLLDEIINGNEILMEFYRVLNSEIRGKNGTLFIFAGLKHNIANIKSIPNIKKCWVEEAETVSDHSWDVLIPTIRGKDSEILITFNPDIFDSPTYQRFVVSPPPYAFVKKVTFEDNPYFPDVLEQERAECERVNPSKYDNIWLGNPAQSVEGAIFKDELQQAVDEGRIASVPYNPALPVTISWDLGFNNYTSIWFAQYADYQWRVFDFHQDQFKKAPHYCEILQNKGYVYDKIWLPHDSENEHIAAERTSMQIVRSSFPNVFVDKLDNFKGAVRAGIEAARNIFPLCVFDKVRCSEGLHSLRRYHYKIDPDRGVHSREPDHEFSDAADSFRYFAMAVTAPPQRNPLQQKTAVLRSRPRLG